MQNSVKNPKKPRNTPKIPDGMKKNASSREMIHIILEKQNQQAVDITDIKVGMGKIEQRLSDYIDTHEKLNKQQETAEAKTETTKEAYKRDWRLVLGIVVSIGLVIVKFVWDAL